MQTGKNGAERADEARLDDVFAQLVRSAFDFLDRAIKQVEEDRKHSIINFATAIELFLKARLFKEHWSLLAEVPDSADRASFLAGEVKTVSPDKAMLRLEKICGDPVPKAAAAEFKRLASHRNKAVHFFHEAASADASKEALSRTIVEQFRGWHHLEELLRSWLAHLGDYSHDMQRVTWLMRRHASFLQIRFEAMKPELEDEAARGATFARCESCGNESAKVQPLTNNVAHLSCRVCGVTNTRLSFLCEDEDCGQTVELSSHTPGRRSCVHCKRFYGNDDVAEILSETSDYDDMPSNINCAACTTSACGVAHGSIVVCSECLIAERDAPECGWCSERQIGGGDLRNSEWSGCEFCDGRAGWERD